MDRRRLLACLAAVALAALPAGQAGAHGDEGPTWEGRCELSGELVFPHPMGGVPMTLAYLDSASGLCTGTLNGAPVAAEPVTLRGAGEGVLSCAAGRSTTSGELSFTRGTADPADDVVFDYTAESTGALTQFVSRSVTEDAITVGRFDFSRYGGPSTLQACQSGTLGSARYDALTVTVLRQP